MHNVTEPHIFRPDRHPDLFTSLPNKRPDNRFTCFEMPGRKMPSTVLEPSVPASAEQHAVTTAKYEVDIAGHHVPLRPNL